MTLPALAIVPSSPSEALVTTDGGYAELVDDGISFFDSAGRLLIRYEDGALTVCPPKGDLVLGSATGAVRIAAATDVVVEAQRDVGLHAPRKLSLDADKVLVEARVTRVLGDAAEIAATRFAVVAKEVVTTAERWETAAAKTVMRSREALEEVTGVLTQKLGRFRGVVSEAYALRTGRTDLRSKDDTSIDGKRVLLG
jgi:hypothetical protein